VRVAVAVAVLARRALVVQVEAVLVRLGLGRLLLERLILEVVLAVVISQTVTRAPTAVQA